jgi:hypothetical protein
VPEPKSLDKKIVIVTAALLICVSALSFVTPAISKKPERTAKDSPSSGAVDGAVGIETYWDSKCTQRVSSIEWGSLEPGTTKTVTLFLKNRGKNSDLQPTEIANYLTMTWDYTGQAITFKEVTQVIFTLCVSENAETIAAFSFDIDIVTTQ